MRKTHQVGQELRTTLSKLYNVCDSLNLRIASAGTHPFATYEDGIVFPEARYRKLLEKHQWMAKRLLIFGLHVHVGMRSGDHAIQVANGLLLYLPLFLALSSSSPFCNREDTQLASSRTTFLRRYRLEDSHALLKIGPTFDLPMRDCCNRVQLVALKIYGGTLDLVLGLVQLKLEFVTRQLRSAKQKQLSP
ncbi:MAG: hypothetical protein IPK68_22105 [Bdellovibrionales bacterium]|nr:hypothetical protein [Bdellovibrionales bacterium]